MSKLTPLPMSQTKDELLRHLNLAPDTYALMAKETDQVYKWLTSEKRHLKKNCKRSPPYDWSDIVEKAKDEAMERIAQSGDARTSYYWSLAEPTEDCPNWIAKWFLYHKFRYRDGRNRNSIKSDASSSEHSRHSHHASAEGQYYDAQAPSYYPGSVTPEPSGGSNFHGTSATGQEHPQNDEAHNQIGEEERQGVVYYDPIRDV